MSGSENNLSWDEIETGDFFIGYYRDHISHSGIKISGNRYFNFRHCKVFGFADNKKPDKNNFPDLYFKKSTLSEVKDARD
jgi:hypothetical protein